MVTDGRKEAGGEGGRSGSGRVWGLLPDKPQRLRRSGSVTVDLGLTEHRPVCPGEPTFLISPPGLQSSIRASLTQAISNFRGTASFLETL